MPKGYLLHHVFKESIFNQQMILVFTLNKKAVTFGLARFLGSLLSLKIDSLALDVNLLSAIHTNSQSHNTNNHLAKQ